MGGCVSKLSRPAIDRADAWFSLDDYDPVSPPDRPSEGHAPWSFENPSGYRAACSPEILVKSCQNDGLSTYLYHLFISEPVAYKKLSKFKKILNEVLNEDKQNVKKKVILYEYDPETHPQMGLLQEIQEWCASRSSSDKKSASDKKAKGKFDAIDLYEMLEKFSPNSIRTMSACTKAVEHSCLYSNLFS